jgi:UDP-2,4-diacetamido-2,4,6-trideoxy-beta-L-altropyranose hydrolase
MSAMKVVIRTDASLEIGSGHVMRCLTLATALRKAGADVSFICRKSAGDACARIGAMGFAVWRLPGGIQDGPATDKPPHARWLGTDWKTDATLTAKALAAVPRANWLVVDHYALDENWESFMRNSATRIMVLDDLADRPHDCDLLLDQNFYRQQNNRYAGLIPLHCQQLLGPANALLRPEFAAARQHLRKRSGEVAQILVFFGASDLENATLKTLRGMSLLDRKAIRLDVVLGVNHPDRATVRDFCASMPQCSCHDFVDDMAELMAAADLYIGAAGTTTWERCCLGLPSLVITVAENQAMAIRDLEQAEAMRILGASAEVSAEKIMRAVQDVLNTPDKLMTYSRVSMNLVDGLGTQRVIDAMHDKHEKAL